jgi:hypothetical protein
MGRLPGHGSDRSGLRVTRDDLVASGVHAQDVQAYADIARGSTGEFLRLDECANGLCTDLLVLAMAWPEMSVRAALGWVLVSRSDPTAAPVAPGDDEAWDGVASVAAPWAGVGRVEDGWLFAAAGVALQEVGAGVCAESPGSLAVLAALRDVPLPVTR